MAVLQKHLVHQLQLRQDLTFRGVSRKISAILTVDHGILTMNPKYRVVSSFHGNLANFSVYHQGQGV